MGFPTLLLTPDTFPTRQSRWKEPAYSLLAIHSAKIRFIRALVRLMMSWLWRSLSLRPRGEWPTKVARDGKPGPHPLHLSQ